MTSPTSGMNPQRAAEHLAVIRQLMERPVRCSVQSGLSGILAGCITLLGLWADSYISETFKTSRATAFWINVVVWASVFVLSAASVVALTYLREKHMSVPFWTAAKRKVLMTILAPFVAAAGLTAAIAYLWYNSYILGKGSGPNEWGLIFPCWMLFYGVACWQVGEFSVREIRVMGAAFILAGILTAMFFQSFVPDPWAAGQYLVIPGHAPYWTMGITFGGFHIVYGLIVWIRHGG